VLSWRMSGAIPLLPLHHGTHRDKFLFILSIYDSSISLLFNLLSFIVQYFTYHAFVASHFKKPFPKEYLYLQLQFSLSQLNYNKQGLKHVSVQQ
jgi:hypothetical protein